MNNEQDDKLVSETYRESAQETTPPKLDEAVLRMAASGKPDRARTRFSTWITPLTWTVTAGLCVALVMNVPDIEQDLASEPMPEAAPPVTADVSPAASIEEAFSAEDADVVQEAEKMASMRDGPDQPAPLSRAREEQARRADNTEKDQQDAAAESSAFGYSASVSADSVSQEMLFEKKESGREPVCDEASRRQAASWYECVLELRDSGRTEDADSEMLELVEQFPDFQPE